MNKNDWNHPLPFGDSQWVKKKDIEPLVKSIRQLLDNIYEFGAPTDTEYVESVESAISNLIGDVSTPGQDDQDQTPVPGVHELLKQHEDDTRQFADLIMKQHRFATTINRLANIILDSKIANDNNRFEAEEAVQSVLPLLG